MLFTELSGFDKSKLDSNHCNLRQYEERDGAMKIKNIFSAAVTLTLAGFFVLSAANVVTAQGRYTNQYSRADVDNIIRRMEQNSDEFRTDFRREMNDSNLNSSTRNRFNGYVAASENAIDDLRRHFDRNDSWWESRSRVQSVVSSSQNVNSMMRQLPFQRQLERQWNQLRNQINRLADAYDLPGLDGGGWQGGGGGGGGWPGGGGGGQRPPSWALGTFRSAYPSVIMTIAANGQVQTNIGGQLYYGRYTNGGIRADGDGSFSTVSRIGNGIRTVNRNTGQTIDFTRNWGAGGDGGGGGGGGDWEGPTSAPPNWAIGNFITNDGIRMTIDRNGRVTSRVQGQIYYGRYYYGSIYDQNGGVSTVTRDGNGFRTYNRANNLYLNFRRTDR